MTRRSPAWREKLVPVTAILTLGVGLVALFLGYRWFWIAWVLGFAVVVPLLAVLIGEDESETESDRVREYRPSTNEADEALAVLRERYARGEIDDAEFERQLQRLLETESIEQVERQVERERADR